MLRLAAILTLLPALAFADTASTASVIDGDTIEIHGQLIRLFGIDAPESSQTCRQDGKPWRCGQQAALALAEKIGRASVRCEERDRDRYGRIVAVCVAQSVDLNRWMVGAIWELSVWIANSAPPNHEIAMNWPALGPLSFV